MNRAPHPTPARLRALPSWVINQTATAANRLTDRALAGTSSRRQFAILSALDEYGPSSQADLGRCTGIDRSDVVTGVTTMVERGFLRQRPDAADGRRNIVTLTPEGKEHLERLGALIADAQDELLRALSPAESKMMLDLLRRVVADDQDAT
ncbi:MarR family winged helix-turn-helix transcriptional regulator [Nonomuraea sp. NPDC049607]|uniref:MarR family winged helix-turn-helix transcriptional regulator n=1 Tax=unclassified Nonomuraea TaxID=2593643 RepID=UPI003432CF14